MSARRRFPSAAARRRRFGRAGPSDLGAAALWSVAIMGLTGGYALLAPAVDDWRSARRNMATSCRIERVIDGDTVDLACDGRDRLRARITGYDAPELFSPACPGERAAAERARRVLQTWVRDAATTEVAFLGRDRYARALVDIRLSGQRVTAAMVETGNGRRYFGKLRDGWC